MTLQVPQCFSCISCITSDISVVSKGNVSTEASTRTVSVLEEMRFFFFFIPAEKREQMITTHSCFLVALCTSEASRYLVEVLESVNPSELDEIIERVLDAVEKQPCKYSKDQCLQITVFNAQSAKCKTFCLCIWLECFYVVAIMCFPTVSSSMIELPVVESAVQDCTQSCDETM